MATEAYKWFFDLEEFTMTKDVTNDYSATVRRIQTLTIEDVAKSISKERTEYRVDTLINIYQLFDEKIRQLVCQGYGVVTGSAQYSPTMGGLFIGTTGEVKAGNKCMVNITPSLAMRNEVAKVKAEFSGNVKYLGGSRIGLVKDVATGLMDGTITPGGLLDVTGTKIRCQNTDGTGIGKVTLVKATDDTVAATITSLGVNDPSRLMFNIPADLATGSYRLKLETYYSSTSTLLKEPRVISYPIELIVGDGGGSGGSDENPDIL